MKKAQNKKLWTNIVVSHYLQFLFLRFQITVVNCGPKILVFPNHQHSLLLTSSHQLIMALWSRMTWGRGSSSWRIAGIGPRAELLGLTPGSTVHKPGHLRQALNLSVTVSSSAERGWQHTYTLGLSWGLNKSLHTSTQHIPWHVAIVR